MLFEARLKVKEAYYSRDWGEVPLKYGELKALIQVTNEAACQNEPDNQFFTSVQKEIQRINKSARNDDLRGLRTLMV